MKRAKAHIKILGLTQEDLAKALGCTRGAVGHYLSGRRAPSFKQFEIIAHALKLSPAWLQYGLGPMEVREATAAYAAGRRGPGLVPITGDNRTGPGRDQGEYLELPFGSNSYALMVTGTSLAPRAREGEALLINPDQTPAPGDEVVVKYRDGTVRAQVLVALRDDKATFDSLIEPEARTVRPLSEIEFMHTIIGLFRPSAVRRRGA